MSTTVAIILPVHNSLSFTRECLKTLKKTRTGAVRPDYCFDIVVVDDGSSDGTAEYISTHHPKVHLVKGDGNLWWTGAIEAGMQYAIKVLYADYLLWWNNDIVPDEDYFVSIADILDSEKALKVYGSKILVAEDPKKVWSFGGFFHQTWGHSYMNGLGKTDGPGFCKPLEADWLPGMGTLLPVKVVRQVGTMNCVDFPQYHGDVDYTRRISLAGYPLEVRPELRIRNHTQHSGVSHGGRLDKLLPGLYHTGSLYNFKKEWLLYRKYAPNPLAYMMLIKKYLGYFVKFFLDKLHVRSSQS